MGYKNCIQDLTTAWFNLLDGNVGVNVYKESVPIREKGNHVLIRAEGETTIKNNSAFFINAVIIIEVVTVFETMIDRSTVDTIDGLITELIFTSPNTYGINSLTNHQITDIQLQSSRYLAEDDGTKKYYSKISRYDHSLNQN